MGKAAMKKLLGVVAGMIAIRSLFDSEFARQTWATGLFVRGCEVLI
jgi:hypothetical protein